MKVFFDKTSERLYSEIPETSKSVDKVFLYIDKFEIGQSYVTAKVQNRYGETVKLNIQGGSQGIELQESLFTVRGRRPRFAYLSTVISETEKILVRKLPVVSTRDWLLIYDDDFFLQAVKDSYDELDIRLVE